MKTMKKFKSSITGHLDIIVNQNENELDGQNEYWSEVLIHGDPEGLRSLAHLLLRLADLDQESVASLPVGAREHEHF
jgi:O-succinylbenzoate synthase